MSVNYGLYHFGNLAGMDVTRVRRVRILGESRRVTAKKKRDRLTFTQSWGVGFDLEALALIVVLAVLLCVVWLVMLLFPSGRRKLKQWTSTSGQPQHLHRIMLRDIHYVTV